MRLVSLCTGLLLTAALVATVPSASADDPGIEVGATSRAAVNRSAPAAPARAGTAVVIGDTGTTGADFIFVTSNGTVVQLGLAVGAPSYAVPGPGVLTSLSHDEGPTAGNFRALFLGPGPSATTRTVQGCTPKFAAVANTLNTYPVRIPIKAGTSLGLWTEASTMAAVKSTPNAADTYSGQVLDPTTTTTLDTSLGNITNRHINISAVWEPDADNDGYGDVSQEGAPPSAATQIECPAPDTKVTKKPKKRSAQRKPKIKFTSSIIGSTFTCKVDKKAAKPCTSPFKKRFSYGKHKVVITAISPLGRVDPAPVTVKFTVVKPA